MDRVQQHEYPDIRIRREKRQFFRWKISVLVGLLDQVNEIEFFAIYLEFNVIKEKI